MKKIYAFVFAVMAVALITVANGKEVEAGKLTKLVSCSSNKYDITNDGNPDKIKVQCYENTETWEYTYKVFVNGKKVYTGTSAGDCFDVEMKYFRVNKKESYLNIYGIGASYVYGFSDLLRYEDGKLKKMQSFTSGLRQEVVKINKKKMIVECYCQPNATGGLEYQVVYKKKAGNWIRASKTTFKVADCYQGKRNGKFKSITPIKLYTKNSCEGKYYNFKSGKTFELLKLMIRKDENGLDSYYGYFKCGKKKGWMFLDDYSKIYFKDIYLAS